MKQMFPEISVTYNHTGDPVLVPSNEVLVCALCNATIPACDATIGLPYNDGSPAFACTVHLQDMRLWLVKWARFAVSQHNLDVD